MSRQWMPIYWGDYLRDTRHLSLAENGAYLLLIAHYWNHSGLPDDPAKLKAILGLHGVDGENSWRSICKAIAPFFQHPGWHHKRIDIELQKHDIVREKRKIAGQKGGLTTQSRFGRGPFPFQANAKQTAYQPQPHKIESSTDSEIEPAQTANGHTHDPGDFGSPTRSLATALPTGALARGSHSQTNSKLKPLAVSPQLEATIKARGWDDD